MGPFQNTPLTALGIRLRLLDTTATPGLVLWDLKVDAMGFAKSTRPQ